MMADGLRPKLLPPGSTAAAAAAAAAGFEIEVWDSELMIIGQFLINPSLFQKHDW